MSLPPPPKATPSVAPPDRIQEMIDLVTQKMRDTYRELGKSLIPLLENTPEDIQMLLELGEVYLALGCREDAITAYERARELSPECLPERVRLFLARQRPPSD